MARRERTYTERQIRNMVINPYCTEPLREAYPFLEEIIPEELTPTIDIEKFLKYISFVYDPNSPLSSDSIDLRKSRAAAEVGFIQAHADDHRGIIVAYLKKITHSAIWAEIVTNESLFWDYVQRLNMPISGENEDEQLKAVERQGKMATMLGSFRLRAQELRKTMFNGDKELESFEQVLENPQDIAKALNKRRKNGAMDT